MNRCIAKSSRSPKLRDSKAASPQVESAWAANLALFPHRLAPHLTLVKGGQVDAQPVAQSALALKVSPRVGRAPRVLSLLAAPDPGAARSRRRVRTHPREIAPYRRHPRTRSRTPRIPARAPAGRFGWC